ncbi:MAG: acetyl-CoA C-acetyltransferase [Geobacteraceae bacterium]|nr:acetyl-CoA C-acetyltransferase [Geobacteraceae bacterium]
MEQVVIVGALRSPVGRLLGQLSPLSAPGIAAQVIAAVVGQCGVKPSRVDEVIMGNVISAGVGQNPARQAALLAGLPEGTAAVTVNKVCASGMKALAMAAQAIMLGEAEVVVAGGMESMSNSPHLLAALRRGKSYGDAAAVDAMIHDGLWDCYNQAHMGTLCEATAKRERIGREDQDRFALASHEKAAAAADGGLFAAELAPVRVGKGEGEIIVDRDETIRRDTSLEKLAGLRPAFLVNGTITAGNSPGLNDGAAALLVMSKAGAARLKLEPLAEIVGWAAAHVDPGWYPLAPVEAVRRLLKRSGLRLADFDLVEENEAFAAQALAVIRGLGLDPARVNVHGGAIALGHPIGASGARIVVTLIHALRQRGGRLGLATLCLGGGGAMAMALRRC